MPFVDITSITIKMLIDSRILKPGQIIYPMKGGGDIEGVLNEDGTIVLSIDSKSKSYGSPSGAAKAVEDRSINGWIYWGVKENGSLVELSAFRNRLKQGN